MLQVIERRCQGESTLRDQKKLTPAIDMPFTWRRALAAAVAGRLTIGDWGTVGVGRGAQCQTDGGWATVN